MEATVTKNNQNYKAQMHKVLAEKGRKDWEKNAHSKINKKFKCVKIKTNTLRVCEVGSKLRNKDCKGIAYRRVHTRFGNKWTCDNCAKRITQDNENLTNQILDRRHEKTI